MGYKQFNPNPNGARVGDCVIRAVSAAMNLSWERSYIELVVKGYSLFDMPSSNYVWGSYLEDNGFTKYFIKDYPYCCSVKSFSEQHKDGIYILATGTHVVSCIDGDYYDSWDSGDEIVLYYFHKIAR